MKESWVDGQIPGHCGGVSYHWYPGGCISEVKVQYLSAKKIIFDLYGSVPCVRQYRMSWQHPPGDYHQRHPISR